MHQRPNSITSTKVQLILFKRNFSSCTNGRKNEKFAFINTIAVILFVLQLSFPAIPRFVSTWEKSYEHIYHSPPHVPVITGAILIMT